MWRSTITALVALALIGCASAPPAAAPGASLQPWEDGSREGLRIWVERAIENVGDDELVIYGNGIAVWDGRAVFRLDRAKVEQVLGVFRELEFETIPEASPRGKRLRRRAGIRSDSYSREATQTWEAPENEALKGLVDRIFAIAGDPAEQEASRAASLADGLEKVARGELPVEVFRLVFHFKGADGDGTLFRVEHGAASSVRYVRGKLGTPANMDVSDQAIRDLARRLAGFHPEQLPVNLYAPDYTEMVIEVLGHDKKVVARQFAGMTRAQHGEQQLRFEQIVAWIREIEDQWF